MNYTNQYLDDVRRQIAPDDVAIKEARARLDLVLELAEKFLGARRTFKSGSLGHRTANCPVHRRDAGLDADGGLVLDRRTWTWLGPDSALGEGPTDTVGKLMDHLRPGLREQYPSVHLTPTKRAILITFNAPLPGGEDPTVDLVMALDRLNKPGLWIPNTETDSWDPSHPEEHTRLLTAKPQELRLVLQHAIRLAKAENKREGDAPLCSFNLEALALMFVENDMDDAHALLALWEQGAADLGRRLTPDPAGVSAPIKVADRLYAIERLRFAARHLRSALERDRDEEHVRTQLYALWPEFVSATAGMETKARMVAASRTSGGTVRYGATGLTTAAVAGTAAVQTSVRSFGSKRPES